MNCLEFLDRLDDLAAGTCAPGEREAAERHAAACTTCADLLADARSGAAAPGTTPSRHLDRDEAHAFLDDVIRQTTGGACRRAEALLAGPAFDGEAASPETQLLAGHLEHCSSCAALAESLRIASRVLPTLAEIDPGPGFTFEVLQATSRVAAVQGAPRLVAWWQRWVARPRFALELAYVATVLLLIVFGNPAASVQAASARTLSAVERARQGWPSDRPSIVLPAGVEALRGAAGEVMAGRLALFDLVDAAWTGARQVWSAASQWLHAASSSVVGQLRGAWHALAAWWNARGMAPTEPGAGEAR